MNTREFKEAKEKQHLDKRAALSCNAVRGQAEEQDIIRTAFQRDRDRIIHSTAFRRLKDKTQVFFMSHNDHVRTRLDHTLAVSQIARTIASSLNLNEDLTEAIALGHDLGHTPFGHDGEHTMNYLLQDGFSHEENGARIARELNLTEEVIDGILNHDSDRYAKTLEGQCVKLADKIAYVTHDFQDALRLGKAPADFKWSMFGLGDSYAKMIDTLVKDVISYSMDKDVIDMSPEVKAKHKAAKKYEMQQIIMPMLERRRNNAREVVTTLWRFYNTPNISLRENQSKSLPFYSSDGKTPTDICDYISRMTDNFALSEYRKINSIWEKKHYFSR